MSYLSKVLLLLLPNIKELAYYSSYAELKSAGKLSFLLVKLYLYKGLLPVLSLIGKLFISIKIFFFLCVCAMDK